MIVCQFRTHNSKKCAAWLISLDCPLPGGICI
jgi:hypothetical protein